MTRGSGPGAFGAVVGEIARGATPSRAALAAGVPTDLAEMIADEAVRLGLLARVETACGTCEAGSLACRGCPLTGRRNPR